MFTIEKNVAIPAASRTGGGKAKYPWAQMEIGDSFFVPGAKVETFYTLVSAQNKKGDARFICRKQEGGVRVWRVEMPAAAEQPVAEAQEPADGDAPAVATENTAEDDLAVPAFLKRQAA
jgi:hypothetical protein